LHDHVTQELIHFKISLGSLVQKGLPAELAGPLDEIYRQLDQIVHRIRSLTFDLSSATLYELGLEAAVREYLYDQVQRGYGIHTEFEDDARPKHLTDDVRALLYRAIRELLINVVKHSRARKVKVTTTRDNGNIRVEVIDDGIGFVPSQYLSKTGGLGLFSICERLDYLGGSMEVDARPGQGTHITLIAPVRLESVEKNVDKDHHEDKNSGSGQSWNSPTGNRRFN
jgi:signal transduction histidine kinase